ncbi:hypothetical protein ACWGJB_40750 [Streptomyces sp. NPDC054813]
MSWQAAEQAPPLHGGRFVYPTNMAIIVVSLLLLCLLCLDRAPLPLVIFAGALVLLVLGTSGPFSSKSRFLVPASPCSSLEPRARTWFRDIRHSGSGT